MASARCPVCEDIITFGVQLKLNEPITCPTCLANLQVVSVNPFELDKRIGRRAATRKCNKQSWKRGIKNQQKNIWIEYLGGEDEDEEFDDYILERRLRYKTERNIRTDRKSGIH